MKRISAAILLGLYIAFSSGVIINLHFCMDRYDSFQLGAAKSDICGKCGMHKTEANQCCNDEVKIFKIDDEQQVSAFNFKFSSPDFLLLYNSIDYSELATLPDYTQLSNNHSPPLSKQDTYLQNCVFRI